MKASPYSEMMSTERIVSPLRSAGPVARIVRPAVRLAGLFMLLSALPRTACAHGRVTTVSTPFSPAPGFEWVWYAYLLGFIALGGILILRAEKGLKVRVFLWTVLSYVISALPAFIWASLMPWGGGGLWFPGSQRNTRIFAGLGWRDVGLEFAIVNLFALVLVFHGILILARYFRFSREYAERRATVMIGLYLVCVLPFVFAGALTHGWLGGYVHGECKDNMEALIDALAGYAGEHQGRLPAGEDMRDIHEKILPYLERSPGPAGSGDPVYVCPVGGTLDRDPKPYAWNRDASAKTVDELISEHQNMILISCPYHPRLKRPEFSLLWLSIQMEKAAEGGAE